MAISIALPPISAAADTASGASSGTRLLNAIVASIDGQAVTLRDLEEFERTRAMFIPPKARDTRQKRLDALVQTRMYRLEYEYGGMEASDADVEKYITNVLEQTSSSREELVATLESLGLGWGDYFERMREEVLRLEVRAEDSHGFWGALSLYPWYYEIPHEDVVFDTANDNCR